MTAAATETDKPRTTDFQIGRYYSPAFVADVFGFSAEWARNECRPDGKFPNAVKLPGSRAWIIPGADVIAVIGERQLTADRAALAAALPTPSQHRREAEAKMRKYQSDKKKAPKKHA